MDRVLPTPAATPFRSRATRSQGRLHALPEDDLLEAARQGDDAALGELWVRHRAAARRLARTYTRTAADADELTDAAFERLVLALRNGGGPQRSFRAYLFTVLRRVASERPRWWPGTEAPAPLEIDVAHEDDGIDLTERELVTQAFATLPDRQQLVLWQTAVEDRPPREVSDRLGLSANAAAALAYRARERLRQAYLQAHVTAIASPDCCKAFASQLGAFVRDSLSARERRVVAGHLEDCSKCRDLLDELLDVDATLRRALVPWWTALGAGGLATAAAGRAGLLRGRSRRPSTRAARHGARVLAGTAAVGIAAVAAVAVGLTPSSPRPQAEPATVQLDDTVATVPPASHTAGAGTTSLTVAVPSTAAAPDPFPKADPVTPASRPTDPPPAPAQPSPAAPPVRLPVRAQPRIGPATRPATAPSSTTAPTTAPPTTAPSTTTPPSSSPPTTTPPTTAPPTTAPPTTAPPTTAPPTTAPTTTEPPVGRGLHADLIGTPFDAVLVTNDLAHDADHLVLTIRSALQLPPPVDSGDWTCARHGEHDLRCTLPHLAAGATAAPVRFESLPLVVASVWAGGDDRP